MQLTEPTRAWIYRVVFAAFAVALVYGIIEDDKIDDWLLLVGAILGTGTNGLASLFTSIRSPEQPEHLDGDLERGDRGAVRGDRGAVDVATIFYALAAIILAGFIILWLAGR